MRVFVTGGTGFVGREILKQLSGEGHTARILVRGPWQERLHGIEGIDAVNGDATDAASLDGALEGCDAVIHLVGIIREFPSRGVTFERLHVGATRNLLDAARQQGVQRFVHMSANGSREAADTAYHRTKWQAEQSVRESGLDWTIFQPSLVYGRGDQFVNMLADQIRKLPAVPVIGDGRYRLSPVAVENVARGFVAALENQAAIGQAYPCGGHLCDDLGRGHLRAGRLLGRWHSQRPARDLHPRAERPWTLDDRRAYAAAVVGLCQRGTRRCPIPLWRPG